MLLNIIEELKYGNLETNSKIVKGWSEKFNIEPKYLIWFWKRAICVFLQDGKKGCKLKNSDWPIIVNIFKAEVKKYLSKLDDDIKYIIKNPTIYGRKAKIHYNEAKRISLEKKVEEYKKEIKECCDKCKSLCKT